MGEIIVAGTGTVENANGAVLSLLFAEGQRPSVDTLISLSQSVDRLVPFAVSHVGGDDASWAELLAGGLTYDCRGLEPGSAVEHPGSGTLLGLADLPQGEGVSLEPAPHLAEGRAMIPVVRMLAGLGADIAGLPGVLAAYWHPARCWMAPRYFRGVVDDWLGGGPFPALGLTALQRDKGGAMVSAGLSYLIGQELRFEPDRALVPAAVARIAVRLIHALVESGPLRASTEFTGPEGERLLVEPVRRGEFLRVTVKR